MNKCIKSSPRLHSLYTSWILPCGIWIVTVPCWSFWAKNHLSNSWPVNMTESCNQLILRTAQMPFFFFFNSTFSFRYKIKWKSCWELEELHITALKKKKKMKLLKPSCFTADLRLFDGSILRTSRITLGLISMDFLLFKLSFINAAFSWREHEGKRTHKHTFFPAVVVHHSLSFIHACHRLINNQHRYSSINKYSILWWLLSDAVTRMKGFTYWPESIHKWDFKFCWLVPV